jgi:hypothetical protein
MAGVNDIPAVNQPRIDPVADPADPIVSESSPGLGRNDRYLDHARAASGGLSDDPTDSDAPVRNKTPFKNLR